MEQEKIDWLQSIQKVVESRKKSQDLLGDIAILIKSHSKRYLAFGLST
jgi:hypothetical protein